MPLLRPPERGEAGRRAASAVLSALLPEGERALIELAASGERVLLPWVGAAP